jgi:recombination protein RecA
MPASKGLAKLRADLTKTYGDRVTRKDTMVRPEFISTGSLTLDYALGGGFALKRTHEIVGPEGMGKTSLANLTMANAQKQFPDRAVAVIDMEQAFDFEWAVKLGVDISEERFFHLYPNDSEDVSDQISMLLRSGEVSLVVVDSIGGMESRAAFEKKAEESAMGKNAQVISRMVKRVAGLAREHNAAVIFINQYRANIGSPRGGEKPAGPSALKYNTTTQIKMSRTSEPTKKVSITDAVSKAPAELEVGRQLRVKVSRHKIFPQGRVADFWFFNVATDKYGPVGIDRTDEAITLGIATGAIKRLTTQSYEFPDGSKVTGGRPGVEAAIAKNPELVEQVRERALAAISSDVKSDHTVSYDDVPDGVDLSTGEILEDAA